MLRKSGSDYAVSGTFVSGYSKPHGMFFKDGWLWFTSDGKVNKARITNGTQPASNVVNVLSDLPEGGHWWRSILVTDSYFYTSIGDDGNINDDTQTDREKIWRYNLDGSGKHLFSSGIRNTEKLWVRPGTTSIYGWDEGSDWYGAKAGDKDHDQPITDWNPPEEFNHYVDGGFYGHPFLMGTRVPRLEYLSKPEIIELANKTIPPAWCGGPHWAAVGWTFIQKKNPLNLTVGDCIVAFHGSWNRSNPSGYRVELLQFDPVIGIPIGSKMLVGTVDSNGNVAGRPVDVVQAPDGSFLFSDDRNNAIYRISASN